MAYLILGYTPILSSFQAPKCVIKAKDPCLHWISVAVPIFLLPEGTLVPEGAFVTQPIPEGIRKVAFPFQHTTGEATSSQLTSKEEDEEEEEKENEIVDVLDLDDFYEVFNQPLSPEISTGDLGQFSIPQSSHLEGSTPLLDEMGIQQKQRSTLQELLESQPGRDAPEKPAQTKLPPPFPPLPTLQADPTDHKRKREKKGKEVAETGKNLPP